jgi:transglutaminase-like putative cysteine protease
MTRLRIRHESVYTFSEPVEFGCWRLLMRPLDTHAIRIVDASLEMPPGQVIWTYDAYGNCVCYLQPLGKSDRLQVTNNLLVERFPAPLAGVDAIVPFATAPVVYSDSDRRVLEPFITADTAEEDPAFRRWLDSVAPAPGELALNFLRRINRAIHDRFTYCARDEPGTQSPPETFARNSGTCRDFAWLMIECVRRLGFAARFATGYLYCPGATVRGAGATHAWCEVFLPSQGWMEFDPTNALVDSSSLIRVATTRTWQEADPMNGPTFGEATCELTVAVDVDVVEDAAEEREAA